MDQYSLPVQRKIQDKQRKIQIKFTFLAQLPTGKLASA